MSPMSEQDQMPLSESQMNEEIPLDELYSNFYNEGLSYEANAAILYTNVAMDFDNITLPGFPSPPGMYRQSPIFLLLTKDFL